MIEICFLEPTRITEKPAPSAASEPAINSSITKRKDIGPHQLQARRITDEGCDLVSYCRDERSRIAFVSCDA
jgi:hypothetical protein